MQTDLRRRKGPFFPGKPSYTFSLRENAKCLTIVRRMIMGPKAQTALKSRKGEEGGWMDEEAFYTEIAPIRPSLRKDLSVPSPSLFNTQGGQIQ